MVDGKNENKAGFSGKDITRQGIEYLHSSDRRLLNQRKLGPEL